MSLMLSPKLPPPAANTKPHNSPSTMNHVARRQSPRLLFVDQIRRFSRTTRRSPSSGMFAATAALLGSTFAFPPLPTREDLFVSKIFLSSHQLNLGPRVSPTFYLQQFSPPNRFSRLDFKNCKGETIASNQINRNLATLKKPILAHEWIVNGKVLANSEQSPYDDKKVVVFLHGLLGNAKVCFAEQKISLYMFAVFLSLRTFDLHLFKYSLSLAMWYGIC